VVLLLVGIAVNLGAVILALAGILVCVTACWYVVARRGVGPDRRPGGGGGGARGDGGGLLPGEYRFFLANIAIWRVTVIAIVAVLAVATGRHALRRTRRALRSAVPGPARPATRPPR
jgi:hypothetical protein